MRLRPSAAVPLLLLIGLAGLLAAAPPAAGQAPVRPFSVGDHLRLYGPDGESVTAEGLVERLDSAGVTLRLDANGRTLTSPLDWNVLLAVRRPVQPSRTAARRGLWGAFLGASVGGIVAPFVARSDDETVRAAPSLAIGAGAGALVGAGIGALLGYLLPQHRWEYVRFRPDWKASTEPSS